MIRRADKILVFDLELTCWDGAPPDGMTSEIIQIGWCFLDPRSGERSGRDSLFVRPGNSTLSQYCTDLTGITPEMMRKGQSLGITSARLLKTGIKQFASSGYGDDWQCVKSECDYANCEMFLSDEYLDASLLVRLALGSYKNVSLRTACDKLGVIWAGKEHRADWDAWNTAGVLSVLMQTEWRKFVL